MKIKYIEKDDKLLIIPEQIDEIRTLGSFAHEKINAFIHPRGLVIAKIEEEKENELSENAKAYINRELNK